MRTQLLIYAVMNARLKFLRILFGNLRRKIISVPHLSKASVFRLHYILIGRNRLSGQKQCKIAPFVRLFHPIALISFQKLETHAFCTRLKGLYQHGTSRHVRTQNIMWMIRLRVNYLFNLCPVHQFI